MTAVKICGVTTVGDAEAAVVAGASFLGLNFFAGSPRRVAPAVAREIADAVRDRVTLVGVFVDALLTEVAAVDEEVGLDLLQFHGNEPPSLVAHFGRRALRALRVPAGGASALPARMAEDPAAWGFLFEARHANRYGGTGESWDYAALSPALVGLTRPFFVAGGVGPGTVGQAIAACRPFGVDVCSRVESAPGRKDPALMAQLFEEVADASRCLAAAGS